MGSDNVPPKLLDRFRLSLPRRNLPGLGLVEAELSCLPDKVGCGRSAGRKNRP
jgi:hypothetical protein